jgi:hypothetical protein
VTAVSAPSDWVLHTKASHLVGPGQVEIDDMIDIHDRHLTYRMTRCCILKPCFVRHRWRSTTTATTTRRWGRSRRPSSTWPRHAGPTRRVTPIFFVYRTQSFSGTRAQQGESHRYRVCDFLVCRTQSFSVAIVEKGLLRLRQGAGGAQGGPQVHGQGARAQQGK